MATMKLSDFLEGVGRPVAFYPGLVKALQDRNEAIFICQMAYWRGKGDSKDGWIYKTAEEIEQETSLTYKEQINVRAGLVKKGLLDEKYARTEHKMYFRVNWDAVNGIWEQFTDGHMPIGKESPSLKSDGSLPEVISLNSNTENTQENTQSGNSLDFKNMTVGEARKVPTLKLYTEATDYFPGSILWETVHNTITENNLTFEKIHSAAIAWAGRGFKPSNVQGILEWAVNGVPGGSKSTPESKPAINEHAVEETKKLVEQKTSGSFVPRPADVLPPSIVISKVRDLGQRKGIRR